MNSMKKRILAIFLCAAMMCCMLPVCEAKADGCDEGHDYIPETGRCRDCGAECSHSWPGAGGGCERCGMQCSHDWSDKSGECTICGGECDGHYWSNGVCSTCGHECEHDWEGTTCDICGMTHSHNWSNGKCTICKNTCSHEDWNRGFCTTCGKEHNHTGWDEDGVCGECNYECPHSSWNNGKCSKCHINHNHSGHWSNGRCSVCGYSCQHGTWNSEYKCSTCGLACPHEFWIQNDDNSRCMCEECNFESDHTGGTATCLAPACCTKCGNSYGRTNPAVHTYPETWEANGAEGHRKIATCGHEGAEIIEDSHTFNTSTHKCTECGYECTHPDNPDDCSICGYKKPAASQPEEPKAEESKTEEESQSSVTVVTPVTAPSNSISSTVVIEKVSSGTPVNVDISKSDSGKIPVSFVEAISKSPNAVANLKVSDGVQLGITNSTLKGAVAAPIVVKAVEPKLLTSVLPALTLNSNIPSDKKLIVMSPVQGATYENKASIYQFYGPEMAGKTVKFYAMDATGKFVVLCESVIYPNGYAAFTVPVIGFIGYAE